MVVYSANEWDLIGFKRGVRKKVVAILKNKKTKKVKELGFGQRLSSTYWDRTGKGGDPTHGDKKVRENYRKRHAGEGYQSKKYSPGYLSWHFLW